jgi:hypothetical protein
MTALQVKINSYAHRINAAQGRACLIRDRIYMYQKKDPDLSRRKFE